MNETSAQLILPLTPADRETSEAQRNSSICVRDVTPHLLRVFLAAGRRIAALHPAGVAVSQRPVVPDSSGAASRRQ